MPSPPPLPIVLGVKATNWRMYDEDAAQADAEFERVKRKAIERDQGACRFCGFRASSWQEVHHRNDDHADNDLKNLVTACMFCHACHHIGLAGRNREAVLAWIPEIAQDRLNHVVRSLLVVSRWAEQQMANTKPSNQNAARAAKGMDEAARAVMAKLRSREAEAAEEIGTSDPGELANVLLQMPPALYDKRESFLRGLRLLPLGRRMKEGTDRMPAILDAWLGTGGPYANLPPRTWVSILRQHVP